MKKGKQKPVVKKGGLNKKKLIIIGVIIVAASMMFSSMNYFMDANTPTTEKTTSNQRIIQYSVTQVGSDMVAAISEERPEVIAVIGDGAKLDANGLLEILNMTAGAINAVDGENALNSYFFIRFSTRDIGQALKEITPALDRLAGDYTLYQGYTGFPPGDTSLQNAIYLLGPFNISRGELVKVLVLEKSSGETKLGFIGFIQNTVPYGTKVKAKVNGITGFIASGLTTSLLDPATVNQTIPAIGNVNYQPPMLVVGRQVNETVIGMDGVNMVEQENSTIITPEGASLEAIEVRLAELGLDYQLKTGAVGMMLPIDADTRSIEQELARMNVTNVTYYKQASIIVPEEVVVNGYLVPIGNNKNFTGMLFTNATAGQDINVELVVIQLGDQLIAVNARQV
ncbi:MAG: hypothetical protein PHG85_02950 [Candidatus Altiarchaeota archaeon]|nr:hypothetical protein [Candidatus Altiarchaeota archaeon]